MSKHPLGLVCALAFTVGAASAGVLYYSPGQGAAVQGVTENRADVGDARGTEAAAAASPDEDARSKETGSATEAESVAAVDAGEDSKTAAGVKGRASAGRRPGRETRAATGYARVSGVRSGTGGRGIAGHTVNGVKKTGEGVKKTGAAIGRTFGKIGGVFHD